MNPGWRRLFDGALRIALGAVFVYAGLAKLAGPMAFADSISSFKILPNAAVTPLALGLPVFEIIVGALLVIGLRRRTAALAIVLSMVIFTAALVSALVRGLVVDCGCFGSSIPTATRMWIDLGRDILLLGAAVVVYISVSDIGWRASVSEPRAAGSQRT